MKIRLIQDKAKSNQLEIEIDENAKVEDLQSQAASKLEVSPKTIKFVFQSTLLHQNHTLSSYGITDGAVVIMLLTEQIKFQEPEKPKTEDSTFKFQFPDTYPNAAKLNKAIQNPSVKKGLQMISEGLLILKHNGEADFQYISDEDPLGTLFGTTTQTANFESHLQILEQLGFLDRERNLQVLQECNGDIGRAISILSRSSIL